MKLEIFKKFIVINEKKSMNKEKINLPEWAQEIKTLYQSGAANQFLLHGNVYDRFLLPNSAKTSSNSSKNKNSLNLVNLHNYLQEILLQPFALIFSYDPAKRLKVLKGKKNLQKWPSFPDGKKLSQAEPFEAFSLINRFLRFKHNLSKIEHDFGIETLQCAIIVNSVDLILPSGHTSADFEQSSMAMLLRDWGAEDLFLNQPLVSILICEKTNEVNPLLVSTTTIAQIEIKFPQIDQINQYLQKAVSKYPLALKSLKSKKMLENASAQLLGTDINSLDKLFRKKNYENNSLNYKDFADLKKSLVEKNCAELIDFIEPERTLEDIFGCQEIKKWLRQDIALWQKNEINALPMGYLLAGPVGTGKTYMVECIAGEAGIPVVKMKNFRARWVGSTEGNLEKIFALLHALGRCIVFIDEADQALGRRMSSSGDSGISGRVYSMFAKEMSNKANRGKILWILASSRPDLIEVDLKRPGRIDVKIPLFPTSSPKESFGLIRALCKKFKLNIYQKDYQKIKHLIPELLTPGAAENIAVKTYRILQTEEKITAFNALKNCLDGYQNPVPIEILQNQIELAKLESSDIDFIPKYFR